MSPRLSISVVMPSFNQAHFIKEAIDSVLTQNYLSLDLLVMDGGSTDGTVDILKSYGDRIRYYSQRDEGQSDAINRGLAQVRGDIVCWLNSDDILMPNALCTVMQAFEKHPEVDFVYGNGWTINKTGEIVTDANVLPFNCWKLIHQRNFIQQPSCFFRKSLFEKVGPIDETLYYVMDWELWIRFAAYQGLYINQYLSGNRTYDYNKTQSGQLKRWREIYKMIRQHTNAFWPPVLTIYFLEASIQTLRSYSWFPQLVEEILSKVFFWSMLKEISGYYSDKSVASTFYFSVGNPSGKERLKLTFTPLSRYDPLKLGQPPITIKWKSSNNRKGEFILQENGQIQSFIIPLGYPAQGHFVHFCCKANHPGEYISEGNDLPARCIIGFLDKLEPLN